MTFAYEMFCDIMFVLTTIIGLSAFVVILSMCSREHCSMCNGRVYIQDHVYVDHCPVCFTCMEHYDIPMNMNVTEDMSFEDKLMMAMAMD